MLPGAAFREISAELALSPHTPDPLPSPAPALLRSRWGAPRFSKGWEQGGFQEAWEARHTGIPDSPKLTGSSQRAPGVAEILARHSGVRLYPQGKPGPSEEKGISSGTQPAGGSEQGAAGEERANLPAARGAEFAGATGCPRAASSSAGGRRSGRTRGSPGWGR